MYKLAPLRGAAAGGFPTSDHFFHLCGSTKNRARPRQKSSSAWIFTHLNEGGEIPVTFLRPRFGKQLKTQPAFLKDELHTAECSHCPLLHRELCTFRAGSAGRAKCSYVYRKLTHSSHKTKVWHFPSVFKIPRTRARACFKLWQVFPCSYRGVIFWCAFSVQEAWLKPVWSSSHLAVSFSGCPE